MELSAKYIIALVLLLSTTTSCKGLFTAQTDRVKKANAAAASLTISGATRKDSNKFTLKWSATSATQQFEVEISFSSANGKCLSPIISFNVVGGSADVRLFDNNKLYACIFLLDDAGNRITAASNNGYLIDPSQLSTTSSSSTNTTSSSSAVTAPTPTPGSIVTSFGVSGVAVPLTTDTDHGIVTAVTVTASGSVYLGGSGTATAACGAGYGYRVYKFDANGAIDSNFNGVSGYQDYDTTQPNPCAATSGTVLQQLKAIGATEQFYAYFIDGIGGTMSIKLSKQNGDSSIDATFGAAGYFTVDSLASSEWIWSGPYSRNRFAQLSNGTTYFEYKGGGGSNFSGVQVKKYDSSFVVDGAYGTAGKFTHVQVGNQFFFPRGGLSLQSDGTIFAAGCQSSNVPGYGLEPSCGTNFGESAVALKVTPAGADDPAFGTTGIVSSVFGGYANGYDMRGIFPLSSGKVLLVGSENTGAIGTQNVNFVRLDSAGALDATYGAGGIATTSPSATGSQVGAALMQSDGKILVGGNFMVGGVQYVGVARYLSDGSFDSTFGTAGVYTFGYADGPSSFGDMTMTSDEKFLYVGGHAVRGVYTHQAFVFKLNL